MTNPVQAIMAINPTAEVAVEADDINQITWLNGTTPIPKSEIQIKMDELQADYDANEYQRDRAVAYPSLKEFAEAYCEKEIGGDSTKWNAYKTAYNKVRTDNPKE